MNQEKTHCVLDIMCASTKMLFYLKYNSNCTQTDQKLLLNLPDTDQQLQLNFLSNARNC